MELIFDKSFLKSIRKLKDSEIKKRLGGIIAQIEQAGSFKDIANVKKMQGFDHYYRIRLGDYRVGVELEGKDKIRFIVIAHRQNIYDEFP